VPNVSNQGCKLHTTICLFRRFLVAWFSPGWWRKLVDNFHPLFSILTGKFLLGMTPLLGQGFLSRFTHPGPGFWQTEKNGTQVEKVTMRQMGLSKSESWASMGAFSGYASGEGSHCVWESYTLGTHSFPKVFPAEIWHSDSVLLGLADFPQTS